MEFFGGGAPFVAFAGSGVEFGGDVVEDAGSVKGQVGAFGEVLAQQSVGRSYVCQAARERSWIRAAASIVR